MIHATLALALLSATLSAGLLSCSSPQPASPGAVSRSGDPRVLALLGQTPPEVPADVRWLNGQPASLAALRGRVVFLQFAFPT